MIIGRANRKVYYSGLQKLRAQKITHHKIAKNKCTKQMSQNQEKQEQGKLNQYYHTSIKASSFTTQICNIEQNKQNPQQINHNVQQKRV